jgi:glutamate carboxypeptidase|tara:strand:- start:402 stop:1658 length:1257 start_codon:yes stop_codon:yes gene_type:complete
MNDIAGAILNAVGKQRDEFLGFLEKLVVHESPSIVPESQEPIFELIGEALDEIGYEIRRIPGNESGGQLLAAPSGRDFGGVDLTDSTPDSVSLSPVQLLIGHCDTVWPIGTLKKMPVRIDDSVMRGPGVFDMKAGLAQTIFALQTLHRLDLEPALLPLVFINSDEEIGSNESSANIVRLAQFASRVFVMEPALGLSGKLKTGRKGVSQFVVNVTGKAAHAGLDPEAGASAILELSHQIQRLFDLNDPLKGVSVNVGIIDGGLRPNVIAPESEAIVDVRVPDSIEAERITAAIHGLEPATKGVSLKIEKSLERAPLERTPRNQALWQLALEAARDLDLEIEQGVAGGGSDGNLTSPFVATLDGLGAVGDGAHANHECINVGKSVERCALLAMLIMAESPTSGGKDVPDSPERKEPDSGS